MKKFLIAAAAILAASAAVADGKNSKATCTLAHPSFAGEIAQADYCEPASKAKYDFNRASRAARRCVCGSKRG